MTLRKLAIEKSVSNVTEFDPPHSEQTPRVSKERKKNTSNIEPSQKDKKFIRKRTAEGFGKLK